MAITAGRRVYMTMKRLRAKRKAALKRGDGATAARHAATLLHLQLKRKPPAPAGTLLNKL